MEYCNSDTPCDGSKWKLNPLLSLLHIAIHFDSGKNGSDFKLIIRQPFYSVIAPEVLYIAGA